MPNGIGKININLKDSINYHQYETFQKYKILEGFYFSKNVSLFVFNLVLSNIIINKTP